MTTKFKLTMGLGASLWMVACRQGGGPEEFEVVEGGICSSQSHSQCSGPDSMLMCVEREWAEMACVDVCALTGLVPSMEGCVAVSGYGYCTCVAAHDSCVGMTAACVSEDSFEGCMDDVPGVFDCADVCASLTPSRYSLGCNNVGGVVAECRCTLEGADCESTVPSRCDDPASLAICVDGAWLIESCDDVCGPDEFGYCSTSLLDHELVSTCNCL